MAKAKTGDRVKVHYTGRLEDGSIFDSSECHETDCSSGHDPLEFVIGEAQVIPGFEQAVVGMEPGDRRNVHIPVSDAYGDRIEEMVAVVNRTDLPAELNPEPGLQLEVTQEDGSTFPVLITEMNETSVTLDANHPLAGQPLIFDIQLIEIL